MPVTYSQARIHAAACGFDLVTADAVPIGKIVSRASSGRGAWLAVDIVDPETLEVVYPAGYWLDTEDLPGLEALGLDYVILVA
jgi:hypothetical protein